MASAFYSNTVHIDFASVLAMEIPGIVSVLHALTTSGLEGFLGCPAVVYESELVEFFKNGLVRDDLVSSEMPKDKIYDARSIVSMSGEPVNLSGRKGQMKIEYRLLCDIMAKSISVKAGSFNSLTVEKFALLTAVVCGVKMNWASVLFNIFKKMVTPGAKQAKGYAVQISLLLENIPNLNLGESSEFPVSKILTAKMVHRYISVTDKESTQEVADASPVKQAPKKPGASKKRPAAEMAPSVPRTRAAAAIRMKQISFENQSRMIRRLRAKICLYLRDIVFSILSHLYTFILSKAFLWQNMAGDRRSDRNNGGEGPSNSNSGDGLSREDLMAIATIVAMTLQGLFNPNNNNQAPPPPPPRGTKFYYESLRKNKAPTFNGSHDSEVAETWMKNVETKLRLLEIQMLSR
ncbi:delphilin-like [Dorcoceras hygrometricum]|uniref:Delphilin-like n=1 Tax=Dorcoceras hygrometricum TaxID=472368 RepID=A0A2Z7D3Y4_9LAMI|nr:delphilin-like [Dorcoceras hygrometricum]